MGHIEKVILEREIINASRVEGHVVVPTCDCCTPGELDLGFLHIYTVELPGSYPVGQADGDIAGPAAKVKEIQTGFQVGKQICSVSAGAAAIEELAELFVISHRVTGSAFGVFGHSFLNLFYN